MQKTKKLVTFILALAVILTLIPSVPAQAASKKATLSVTSMTIPIGTLKSGMTWYTGVGANTSGEETAQKLTVKNKVSGAAYTFTSSNTKVVKIAKSGGYPTGVKAGSATITCKQTLKGKTTTVGKCKVKVKAAKYFAADFEDREICVGTTTVRTWYAGFGIQYRNAGATYKYVCNKSGLTLKDMKWTYAKDQAAIASGDYGKVWDLQKGETGYYTKVTAKKAGTYTITVKETYKKKTRKIGTFKITVYEPTVKSDVEVYIGNWVSMSDLVEHVSDYSAYKAEVVEGADLLKMEADSYGNYSGEALAKGTVKIKITEEKTGTELGTVTVTIKDIPCTDIETYEDDYIATYVGDDEIRIGRYFDLEPYETTDSWSASCENEGVFKLTEEDDEYYGIAVAEGETTVTITCGSQSADIRVVVYADEDAYDDAE